MRYNIFVYYYIKKGTLPKLYHGLGDLEETYENQSVKSLISWLLISVDPINQVVCNEQNVANQGILRTRSI